MLTVPGFTLIEKLHKSYKTLVYRAIRQSDNTSVILKILTVDFSNTIEIARLEREYNIIRNLQIDGVAKAYSFEKLENTTILVLEDIGGQSLANHILSSPFKIHEFLKVAVQIASTLARIHEKSIIHKDLKPANIIYNRDNNIVKIIDFSISSEFPRESIPKRRFSEIEGTLVYSSPEQTGWMNRLVDYRSDFYTLGITFYHMLCGKPPFVSDDPLELIHSHLASQPSALELYNPQIPPVLSAIVLKLLAKNPEDRYKTALGLQNDLEYCLHQYESTGSIRFINPGENDISGRIQIPEKLFGRENELQILFDAYRRVSGGTAEVIFVSGEPGIGKSAFSRQLFKPVVQNSGFFISGKFEQFNRDKPFNAFIQAFDDLVNQILTRDSQKVETWKNDILRVLGSNLGVMTYLVPRLEMVTGSRPLPTDISILDVQNRFHLIIINFLEIFACEDNPLVLFIDDLQWADSSSLKLLEIIATSASFNHLMIICSYRDNELVLNPVLNSTITKIAEFRNNYSSLTSIPLRVENIRLREISERAVCRLVEETLNCSEETAKELSELVSRQTGGNPFFINRFLSSLHTEKLIEYNRKNNRWLWDLKNIRQRGFTDNVIQLMKKDLEKSHGSTSEILKIASCIGNTFSRDTLSSVMGKSRNEIRKDLAEAINEGYIFILNDSDLSAQDLTFQFQHDQILSAANQLLEAGQKKELHLRIGSYFVQKRNELVPFLSSQSGIDYLEAFSAYSGNAPDLQALMSWADSDIFVFVNHFNAATDLINETERLTGLAILNLLASRFARKSVAFATSLEHSNTAIKLLPKNCWEENYNLAVNVYTEAAECEFINTNFSNSEKISQLILTNAKSIIDKIKIFEIKIASLTPQNKFREAIEAGMSALLELGIKLPRKPTPSSPFPDIVFAFFKMSGKLDRISALPEMNDPVKTAAMNIMVQMITPSFISVPELFPVLVLKMVHLSLKYGLSSSSAYAFAFFGMILGSGLGKFKAGYELSELALKVLNQTASDSYSCKVFFVVGNMVRHWKNPLSECQQILETGYKKGIESGDLLFASYSLNWFNAYNYLKRLNLNESLEKMIFHKASHDKIKQKDAADFYSLWMQFVSALCETQKISGEIKGRYFDETSGVKVWEETGNDTDLFTYNMMKGILHYLKKNYTGAIDFFEKAITHSSGVFGMPVNAELNFFYSLSLAAAAQMPENRAKKYAYLGKIKKNQKKMKVWGENSPHNYMPKYLLVEAERLSIQNNPLSVQFYDESIKSSSRSGLVLEQALACELLAISYLRADKSFIAYAYLREAYSLYIRWGGFGKTMCLDEEFPELLGKSNLMYTQSLSSSEGTMRSTIQNIDLDTVLKVSQNISNEIDLEKLTEKLVQIAIESAGASRGYLALERDGKLLMFAEGEGKVVRVLNPAPVENYNKIALGVVNFVRKTGETVVLNDTSVQNPFQSDIYIARAKPKAILCLPVKKHKTLIGLLYLENQFLKNVFTDERLNILGLLSTQAIISLENASYVKKIKSINTALENEISEHKKTEEDLLQAKERYALAARGANDGLWDWDLKTDRIYYSPRWKSMIGYSESEIGEFPSEWFQRVHEEDLPALRSSIDSHIEGILPHLECEYRIPHRDGRYLWIITRGLAVRNESNAAYRMAGSNTEITNRKLAEEQLRHDALFDSLTGLPNWNLLLDRTDHAIKKKNRQPDYLFAVLFFDIDRFKVINDSLGHEFGNHLLVEVSRRLVDALRPEDTVARLGGDEYGILLDSIADINEPVLIINRIREHLMKPFDIRGQELFITISLGVVISTREYIKPEDMIRDADTAMHKAKAQGRNRYEIFNKAMHASIMEYLKTDNDLRKALEKNEFRVFYQPIIDTMTGQITGAEALARWNFSGKIISPIDFIPIAEETGLIIPIGEWVMQEACRQTRIWHESGLKNFIISVNISGRQFEQKNFLEVIDHVLKESRLDPSFLQLELTESMVMGHVDRAKLILEEIRKRKIQVAIDDFGTGYSSLSYLKEFPVQKLKIDRSFIQNMVSRKSDAALVKAIIAMSESLNLKIIAEGVETDEQLEILKSENCSEAQGYLFSKPLSADQFIGLYNNKA